MLHLNAFSQCTPHSQAIGQWKNPLDKMSLGYLDLVMWTHIAKTLERGCLDALFLADIHGIYDGYAGSRNASLTHAVQVPGSDPLLMVSALAAATKNIGFACTYSTTYHAPYECARAFSSLDHFTKGRIGWNIVTSYVKNAEYNGLGTMLPHDERYDRAEEYMEVVYKLWEGSWEEDAATRNLDTEVHSDPAKVHEVNHEGEYFSVSGPHMCEPSPQRTPFLYQAGSSPRGIEFGAKHAEAIFMNFDFKNLSESKEKVRYLRERIEAHGREPKTVKIMMPFTPIVGETDKEALAKQLGFQNYFSTDGLLALFAGHTGIDLHDQDPDLELQNLDSEGMRAFAKRMNGKTVRDYLSDRPVSTMVGSPKNVADKMETLHEIGIDGFVASPIVQPGSHEDLVDLLVPELQSRGLFRKNYVTKTLREHYSGQKNVRTSEHHPSAEYRL